MLLRALGTATNAGSIVATGGTAAFGVFLVAGGYASNAASGSIASTNIGVEAINVASTVVNAGSISDSRLMAGAGVQLRAGGTIVNQAGGSITSQWIGAQIGAGAGNGNAAYANGTVLNAGFIQAADTLGDGAAVWIKGTGLISNAASGTIVGGGFGVVSYSAVTITNAGSIGGISYALFAATAGVADRVIVAPGARFSGLVEGSSTSGASVGTLELMAGGAGSVSGFGSQYVGFSQVTLDPGARWSLAGTVAAAQTIAFAAGASLTLASPAAVQGTITNFATTDVIALAGVTDVTSATLGTGNLLSIAQSAGPTLTLQLDPAQRASPAPPSASPWPAATPTSPCPASPPAAASAPRAARSPSRRCASATWCATRGARSCRSSGSGIARSIAGAIRARPTSCRCASRPMPSGPGSRRGR